MFETRQEFHPSINLRAPARISIVESGSFMLVEQRTVKEIVADNDCRCRRPLRVILNLGCVADVNHAEKVFAAG